MIETTAAGTHDYGAASANNDNRGSWIERERTDYVGDMLIAKTARHKHRTGTRVVRSCIQCGKPTKYLRRPCAACTNWNKLNA